MNILAIDTSSSMAGVAVYDGRVLAETTWRSGRNHSRALLGVIETALKLAGIERTDLTGIALASGPGSYSGLRVGASVAIGLSLALGIDVVHVPTLEVLASGVQDPSRPIRAAVEVGRGRYATARYERAGGEMTQQTDIESMDGPSLARLAASEGAFIAAELEPELLAELDPAAIATPATSVRRPSVLAELALRRLMAGRPDSEESSQLIYLNN